MKIRKITAKNDEDIAILIKRGSELFSITIDANNNIEINGYESDMALLEELAVTRLQNQQIEDDLMNSIMNMQDIDDAPFMRDEEGET